MGDQFAARAGGLIVRNPMAPGAWTPASLPSLIAWYDAANAASITSSGGLVSQWNDLSGNANHLVQATGANKPTTGVDTIGGVNAIKFVGGTPTWLAVTFTALTQPSTILMVINPTSFAQANVIPFDSNDGAARHQTWVQGAGSDWGMYAGAVANVGLVPVTGAQQIVSVYNNPNSNFYRNGTQTGGNLTTNTQTMHGLTLGSDASRAAGAGWVGDIAEFVIMNAAISGADRTNWNTYCARWGL